MEASDLVHAEAQFIAKRVALTDGRNLLLDTSMASAQPCWNLPALPWVWGWFGEASDAPEHRGAAGLAPLARVVLPGGQLAVPGQQRRGCDRKAPAQRRRGMNRVSAGEPGPVSWLVPDPAVRAAQHHVLVAEHEDLSVLRLVPAEYQDGNADDQRISR
ncbi:MAG TPA: hypothetical protein VIJ82_03805 [Streptosporangiaceae bacterium]